MKKGREESEPLGNKSVIGEERIQAVFPLRKTTRESKLNEILIEQNES